MGAFLPVSLPSCFVGSLTLLCPLESSSPVSSPASRLSSSSQTLPPKAPWRLQKAPVSPAGRWSGSISGSVGGRTEPAQGGTWAAPHPACGPASGFCAFRAFKAEAGWRLKPPSLWPRTLTSVSLVPETVDHVSSISRGVCLSFKLPALTRPELGTWLKGRTAACSAWRSASFSSDLGLPACFF